MAKNLLPKKSEDISEWYTAIVRLADLADYGPVKGTIIFKPYGYGIWERVQAAMDPMIKAHGVDNAYFPLLIPMSFLEKEKSHVEGFSPELAVVTHGGGEKLEEPVVVRPTSETIMYNSYAKWIQSWRDLPLKINQWNSVVRWEMRTAPFLRTSEFLWQEGHTAHATHEEAIETQNWAMDMYAKIYRDYFALDGYIGFKSSSEKFAGADTTLTFESLMPSGKALQACTSHDLGQNFAKAFDVSFQDKEGNESHVWQTSWGFSTRSIGGLILAHGDDNGLVLPPMLAPVQVVIVPVRPDNESLVTYAQKLADTLAAADIRVKLDARDDESFGYRLNKWEVKGVPLVIKLGDREMEANQATLKRRDTSVETTVALDELVSSVSEQLTLVQSDMLAASTEWKQSQTREAKNYDEFKQILADHKGFVKVAWNDNPEIEAKIKADTKATSRCRLVDETTDEGAVDFYTGEPAKDIWLFAQSY